MVTATLTDKENSEETFRQLAATFNLSDSVLKAIKAAKIDTLADLRFYFAEEGEVEKFLTNAAEKVDDPKLQTSRLRGAWHAVRQHRGRAAYRLTRAPGQLV